MLGQIHQTCRSPFRFSIASGLLLLTSIFRLVDTVPNEMQEDTRVLTTVGGSRGMNCEPTIGILKRCGVCDCCEKIQDGKLRIRVECRGHQLTNLSNILSGLPTNLTDLTLLETGLRVVSAKLVEQDFNGWIFNKSLSQFIDFNHMQELLFKDNPYLSSVEKGAFDFGHSWDGNIRHLTIFGSPLLKTVKEGAIGNLNRLNRIKIYKCGLVDIPNWQMFRTKASVTINLSGNNIKRIKTSAFFFEQNAFVRRRRSTGQDGISVHDIILDDNPIESIEDYAFKDADIVRIIVRNINSLTKINTFAFDKMKRLQELDLSGSSISTLPTKGLDKLKVLVLENIYTLKVFPSVLDFRDIKTARLTSPYHCCAFAHPEKQDKDKYLKFQQESICPSTTARPTSPLPLVSPGRARKSARYGDELSYYKEYVSQHEQNQEYNRMFRNHYEHQNKKNDQLFHRSSTIPRGSRKYLEEKWLAQGNPGEKLYRRKRFDDEYHDSTINPNIDHTITIDCGDTVINDLKNVSCIPAADEFNPCEDVMYATWLRVLMWFVVILALIGNISVLIVTLGSTYKCTVSKFLMCNLAFADLTLGLYLLILVSFDMYTKGFYFRYAIPWQDDGGCLVAGFLAIFATCLSTFTLSLLTLERWYAISYAIHLDKRIKLRTAVFLMISGWAFALLMAALPLFGISDYGITSTCLPMETKQPWDKGYVITLLLINIIAFIIITCCYINMYCQVKGNNESHHRGDANIAKRMAVLVFTDFVCLSPIALFGIQGALGDPWITVTSSKILLVFIFPLNSCANPFLYAILTKQFRKDFFSMFNRFGLFERTNAMYRMAGTSNPMSYSHSRNSLAAPMAHTIHRPSDDSILNSFLGDSSTKKTSAESTPKVSPRGSPRAMSQLSAPVSCGNVDPTPTADHNQRKLSIVPETSYNSEECSNTDPYFDDLDGTQFQSAHTPHMNMPLQVRSISQYAESPHKKFPIWSNSTQDNDNIDRNHRKQSDITAITILSDTTDIPFTDAVSEESCTNGGMTPTRHTCSQVSSVAGEDGGVVGVGRSGIHFHERTPSPGETDPMLLNSEDTSQALGIYAGRMDSGFGDGTFRYTVNRCCEDDSSGSQENVFVEESDGYEGTTQYETSKQSTHGQSNLNYCK